MRSHTITCDFCRESFPWKGAYEPGWAMLEEYGFGGLKARGYELCPKCRVRILKLRVPDA
jgi:hypothetical protein